MATAAAKRRRASWRWMRSGLTQVMPYPEGQIQDYGRVMINGFLYFITCIPTDFEIQMEADLENVFFNIAEFAVTGTYLRSGGTSYPLKGLFNNPYQESIPGTDYGVQSQDYTFKVQDSDIVGSVGRGDVINICGMVYQVKRYEPDGVGVTVLILHKVPA